MRVTGQQLVSFTSLLSKTVKHHCQTLINQSDAHLYWIRHQSASIMYHSGLIKEFEPPKKVDYSNLKDPESETNKVVPPIPTDVTGDVPDAPDGFVFYRVQNGDTLVGLAVKFGISESKIRRYNNKACFGHRLTHIIGKLMLIPVNSGASMSKDVREQIASVYAEDNERKQDEEEFDGKQYTEPDENGKYQLKKALMYHAKGVDDHRAAFYLGIVV